MLDLRSIINLTGNRNTYIAAREKLAANTLKNMRGRLFFYNIPELCDNNGFCTIDCITYDRQFDAFIYVIKDRDTNHTFVVDRCNLCLIEVSC